MVQTKGSSKKQQKQKQKQKRGVDFKKIKRKLGRKLPPPQNATNTEIKSKAIILPEQSVASEKTGLPVSKKGLTLKELLQHTSHHNPKVRKDALIGIQDIFQRYPAELKLHKLAVIEKLRERMRDDDKFVRESLYQLLKSVVFPNCKEEDNQGPFISLMMAYIFNAMTHLAIDVRLMAFKFLDLVIQYYPSCFSLYADKILQNFDVILRKNQFYLQDKGKLKTALAGLTGCLLLLPCNKKKDNSSRSKVTAKRVLHAYEPDVPKDPAGPLIMKKLNDLFPVLVNCFQDFKTLIHSMPVLDAQSFDCMLSILQSIVLTIRFFAYEMERSQEQLWPHNEEINIAMLHQTMSPALMKKLWDSFPLGSMHQLTAKDNERYFTLNIIITEIFLRTSDWISPPVASVEIFLQFIESALSEKISSGVQSGKAFHEKQLLPIVPFIPKLTKLVSSSWKHQILQSFNRVFKNCNPESSLKLACLSAIAEFLCPEDPFMLGVELSDPEIRDYQISWIRDLPSHLILLGDKHPSCSEAVVRLQLRMGQRKSFQEEYDNLQYSLLEFYSTRLDDGSVHHGPFVKLPSDIQELCLCCLCYVSVVDPLLLQSLALCCLCDDLEPKMQLRIVEVLEEAYTQGHIQIADYISFLLTLLARYKVYPDKVGPVIKNDSMSNRHAFRSITHRICSSLLRIGDAHLLFQIMENITIDQISREPPVDNMCALLRMLAHLDSSPTRLSERSIIKLSCVLPGYLIDVVSCIGEDDQDSKANYYLVAVFYLFTRSNKLRTLVIKKMAELVPKDRSTCRISAIVSAILLLAKDDKVSRCLLCCKTELECILCSILELKSCEEMNLNIEENHKIQCAFDQLNSTMTTLFRGALIA